MTLGARRNHDVAPDGHDLLPVHEHDLVRLDASVLGIDQAAGADGGHSRLRAGREKAHRYNRYQTPRHLQLLHLLLADHPRASGSVRPSTGAMIRSSPIRRSNCSG